MIGGKKWSSCEGWSEGKDGRQKDWSVCKDVSDSDGWDLCDQEARMVLGGKILGEDCRKKRKSEEESTEERVIGGNGSRTKGSLHKMKRCFDHPFLRPLFIPTLFPARPLFSSIRKFFPSTILSFDYPFLRSSFLPTNLSCDHPFL